MVSMYEVFKIMTDSEITDSLPCEMHQSLESLPKVELPEACVESPAVSPDSGAVVRQFYESLRDEYPLKSLFGQELLRQAASQLYLMNRAGEAQLSAIKLGMTAGKLFLPGSDPSGTADAGLLSAFSNPAAARSCQFQQRHLQQFRQLLVQIDQLFQREVVQLRDFDIRTCFPDERACRAYLQTRLLTSSWCCPECNHPHGDWLARRARWECRNCRTQTGIRHGTVMAQSKLPLRIWFHAIDLVAHVRPMTGTELAQQVGIDRVATAMRMQTTVRAALMTEDADRLLAGIQHLRNQSRS